MIGNPVIGMRWCKWCLAGILLLGGCAARPDIEKIDNEMYGLVEEKSSEVEDMVEDFSIDYDPVVYEPGDEVFLNLSDALDLAFQNSRAYQSRKESLYTEALSLSSTRHRWGPRYSAGMSGGAERSQQETTLVGGVQAGVSKMLSTGGDLSLNIASNALRNISLDDPVTSITTSVSAIFVQPLMRGRGKRIAMEDLTQQERDLVYAIRDYVRYRRQLYVQVTRQFYNLVQQQDQIRNVRSNYENLEREYERAEILAEAGRWQQFQVDQTRQRMLSAHDRWIRTEQGYKSSLDDFKLTLGIPAEVELSIDEMEFDDMVDMGLAEVEWQEDDAIKIALENRLDYKNIRDQVEDAWRRIILAEDNLKATADLRLEYRNVTADERKPLSFSSDDARYSAMLDIDLAIDKKIDINTYRRSLIQYGAMERTVEEKRDSLITEVREAFRRLEQAQQRYEVQLVSLELAQRRVDSVDLLQEAGRVSTRDVLDAQEDLLNARNNITASMIDHINARNELLLALEVLQIGEETYSDGEDNIDEI